MGTGWAVLVTVGGGDDDGPVVVDRRRAELVEGPGRFVYHLAAELPPAEAEAVASEAGAAAAAAAATALADVVRAAEAADHRLARAVVVGPPGNGVGPVAEAVRTHTTIHTAEGELYRSAVRAACRASGLVVDHVPARELADRAALTLGRPPEAVAATVARLGRELGPPWRRQHKDAALAAWMSLAE